MIDYSLPDFTAALGLNLFFARMAMEHPERMREGVRAGSIYGCFPSCPLNGGRANTLEPWTRQKIRWTFSVLREYGLKPRLTLTNMLAGKAEWNHPYSRMILEEAADAGGEAIVYSPELARLIREEYALPLVLSTTYEINDIQTLNEALERYDCVVLNYNRNKDADFLSGVSHPERLEIMVNEYCRPHCPNRRKHYLHNSSDQLEGALHDFPCPARKPSFFEHEPGHPVIFTNDEVRDTAERWGVTHYKIVGRGTSFEANLEALSYYLVADEYRDAVKRQVQLQRRS